jgi:hypothetical protein
MKIFSTLIIAQVMSIVFNNITFDKNSTKKKNILLQIPFFLKENLNITSWGKFHHILTQFLVLG